MRKGLLLAACVGGLCNLAFAQTVDQGKKFLYYLRYTSANDVFDKILAGNPNNIEAVYWKGQTLLGMHDSVAAGALYSKTLQTNGSAPLLLVGMGGVELRNGKTQEARQRFETAISLTKGKDIHVLDAIADNNIDAHNGDAQYALEKLTLATQTKNFNNAETYVLMGDAYRKLIDGGNAVQSYQKALGLDPKLAEAKYKIGKIYETQKNVEFYLPAYQDAVQLDPSYAPAYYALFTHYFNHGDLAKSTELLNKYIASTDPSPELDYLRASLLLIANKNDEAISEAKGAIQKLGDKVYPKYYLLAAYAYDAKGDSMNAKDYLTQYFQKQKPDAMIANDWAFRGKVLTRFPKTDSVAAIEAYMKAISMDTALTEKQRLIKEASDAARNSGNKGAYAYWLGVGYPLIKNPNQSDVYNWGMANYQSGNYKAADSIFCGIYQSKYPTEIYGYLWCARAKQAQDDSVNSQGLAVAAYEKLAEVGRGLDATAKTAGSADSTKYKSQVINSYFFLAGYYNDQKHDKPAAIAYMQKVLEVDPTNTAAQNIIKALTAKPVQRQPTKTGTRPKSSGGK